MAHDGGVLQQALHVGFDETGDGGRVEAGEGAPESLAFVEDRQPRQARLKAFQAQLLEQAPVVGDCKAPLGVVIIVLEFCFGPGTAVFHDSDHNMRH